MKMQDWIKKLDGFLQLNDRDILKNAGKISHQLATEFAEKEYDKFHQQRLKEKTLADGDFEIAIAAIDSQKKKPKKN